LRFYLARNNHIKPSHFNRKIEMYLTLGHTRHRGCEVIETSRSLDSSHHIGAAP
jgi:hypothetical protein